MKEKAGCVTLETKAGEIHEKTTMLPIKYTSACTLVKGSESALPSVKPVHDSRAKIDGREIVLQRIILA